MVDAELPEAQARENGDDAALRRELRSLEESYWGQPPVVQQQDLVEINQLRARLGMPLVNERLVEIRAVAADVSAPAPAAEVATQGLAPEPTGTLAHQEARALYQRYLEKVNELDRHRRYARRVAEATAGEGMTPVLPLATMGTGGGPLLCDHCQKPLRLEGGRFHGKAAQVAWGEHPAPSSDWVSWILGGLVVEIQANQTLRIYHGYPGRRSACCEQAFAANEQARREHDSAPWFASEGIVSDLVREELLPGAAPADQQTLTHQILDLLFGYDPGLGVNRPGE